MKTSLPPLALLLACALPAHAMDADQPATHVDQVIVHTLPGLGAVSEMRTLGPGLGLGLGAQIKNAPFSAEIVTERTQQLADGNQIVHKSTRRSYRDSAGRVRQETLDDKGQVLSVHIADPVDEVQYTLNPATKSGAKIAVPNFAGKSPDEIRAFVNERMKAPGQRQAPAGERVEVIRNVRVMAPEGGAAPIALERVAQAAGVELSDRKWAAQAVTTQLGARDLEGVRAEGTHVSYTIPAGEIGNRGAITVTTEKWYSPELQMIVSMKRSDPRSGDTSYRVVNLKRAEPARALFSVPEGYKMTEPAPRMLVVPRKD